MRDANDVKGPFGCSGFRWNWPKSAGINHLADLYRLGHFLTKINLLELLKIQGNISLSPRQKIFSLDFGFHQILFLRYKSRFG